MASERRPARVGWRALIAAAREARARAVAPYSDFAVGAAIETADGTVFTGCNIENATYGLTLCAERVAIFKALSEGHRAFRRLAVVADTDAPTPPCGACRQILWEYAGDIDVALANLTRTTARHRMGRLLPEPFDARLLHEDAPRGGRRQTGPAAGSRSRSVRPAGSRGRRGPR